MIEPVPYEKVMGLGFYRQFLTTEDWPGFMRAGRQQALRVLHDMASRRAGADMSSLRPGFTRRVDARRSDLRIVGSE